MMHVFLLVIVGCVAIWAVMLTRRFLGGPRQPRARRSPHGSGKRPPGSMPGPRRPRRLPSPAMRPRWDPISSGNATPWRGQGHSVFGKRLPIKPKTS